MKALLKAAVLLSVCAMGCIDLEGAYAGCVDGGRCATDAGDATDAGGDAGTPDAGAAPYDGGPKCNASPNPRLRCDAPLLLGMGAGIGTSALAASGTGFIAGWAGATVELREVHLDGGTTSLITGVAASSAQLSVDAKGARWAAAWVDANATSMKCVTSTNSSQISVSMDDGGLIDAPTIALAASGAVALSARNDPYLLGGSSTQGCPSRLAPLPVGTVNGVGVVATNAPGDNGFRYVWTHQLNPYNGTVSLGAVGADGGLTEASTPTIGRSPQNLGVAASSSGATVFTAYSAYNTNDVYEFNLWASSADLSGDGIPAILTPNDPGWWALGACGPGCMAIGFIAYELPGPATVYLRSDDAEAASQGAWDVACGLQPQMNDGATIAVAGLAGRLGVLLTSRSTAKLYLCDLPPPN